MARPPLTATRQARRLMTSAQRREQLIAAAAAMFEKHPYSNVRMEQIARSVGVAKPTLYHYFSSRDELLVAVHDEFIDLLISKHRSREHLEMPASEKLFEDMADIMDLMVTHRGHVRVAFEHHRELPPRERRRITTKRDQYERMLESLINQAVDDGEFTVAEPHMATLAIFGSCNWAYQWFRASHQFEPREVARMFWEFFVYGLTSESMRKVRSTETSNGPHVGRAARA